MAVLERFDGGKGVGFGEEAEGCAALETFYIFKEKQVGAPVAAECLQIPLPPLLLFSVVMRGIKHTERRRTIGARQGRDVGFLRETAPFKSYRPKI